MNRLKRGAKPPKRTTPGKPKKPRLPDDLPVYEEVLDPEEVKEDPEQYRKIGKEVSEQLDYHPAQFLKRRLRSDASMPVKLRSKLRMPSLY